MQWNTTINILPPKNSVWGKKNKLQFPSYLFKHSQLLNNIFFKYEEKKYVFIKYGNLYYILLSWIFICKNTGSIICDSKLIEKKSDCCICIQSLLAFCMCVNEQMCWCKLLDNFMLFNYYFQNPSLIGMLGGSLEVVAQPHLESHMLHLVLQSSI